MKTSHKILFAALLLLAGCSVSRTQYLRDRLQDSLEKQEQRKFNAEVLRALNAISITEGDDRVNLYKEIYALHGHIAALEKKIDERKPCVYFSTSIVCHEQEIPRLKYIPGNIVAPKRPNWPCFLCDEEKTK